MTERPCQYDGLSRDEQRLLNHVREYGEKHFTPASISKWRKDQGLPDEMVKAFVDLDFNGFGVIHRRNHRTYDLFAQVLVIEELSCISGVCLPFQNDLLQLQILEAFASSAQTSPFRTEYQDTGRLSYALAISEPEAGSDTRSMRTHVTRKGDALVMNGTKMFVNNGEYAPALLVSAYDKTVDDGEPEFSFWMVPRSAAGIYAYPEQKIGQSMLPFATVRFDNVEVQESWRLKGSSKGFSQLYSLLEYGRVFTCAAALGEAQAAMEDAVAWARGREAFGQRIADLQQVQMKLTEMEVKLTNMRNLVYGAAREYDRGGHKRLSVALMKYYVPKAATEVASDAMQILGGRGYIQENRVSSIWQDCRGYQFADGTDEVMVVIAASLILEQYKTSKNNR